MYGVITRSTILGAAWLICTVAGVRAKPIAVPDSLPPGVTAEMVQRGYTLYHGVGMCINCHGAEGAGMLGPTLSDAEWWHAEGSYLAIVRQVLMGVPKSESQSGNVMPPRGGSHISDAEVFAVSAHVWSLSHQNVDTLPLGVTPQLVEKGKRVFEGGGKCSGCHGADATGDVGPNLTDHDWLHAKGNYLSIVRQILMGVPLEQSRSGIYMPPRGGSHISDADVHAVAAYVWVISRRIQ